MQSLTVAISGLLLLTSTDIASAAERVLHQGLLHLRVGGEREWAEFPEAADAETLRLDFDASPNAGDQTLRLRQQDVKQDWRVRLNGRELGRLTRDENDMVVYFSVPPDSLRDGRNELVIEQSGRGTDDIRVGELQLDERSMNAVLNEAQLQLLVRDFDSGGPTPCRVTILNEDGALQSIGAASNATLAVRPGVAYTADGRLQCGLPAGNYTVYAGRGFEYGIDRARFTLKPGETIEHELTIRREVPTGGWVACDTHVHTLTHSGHGDASIAERMITLAGEGIELPIATDHNVHIDYDSLAREMGLRRYFTPVIGNEVTTKVGHFNVFPVERGAGIPDFRLSEWEPIFESIFATPHVRVCILNHARDLHSGVRPFGPAWHNALVGENLQGWELRANAMEVINSAAQQTDMLRLVHDWFGMLNAGKFLTPVGSSDSHDVARHFVGQGRTYIRVDDADPGHIDVEKAVESFLAGRVSVSLGLLAEISVNDQAGAGELARLASDETVRVRVRVLGPAWATAEIVELYVNGRKTREATIRPADGGKAGLKWEIDWELPRPDHDVFLAAVARGPGVRDLYWPIAKPYQPTSPQWTPQVMSVTGAVWLDADGDGRRTPARDYARRIVQQGDADLGRVVAALEPYDSAVAVHAAWLLHESVVSLTDARATLVLNAADPHVTAAFRAWLAAWRETELARREP